MTLYRLPYSPYARKVQLLLELLGRPFTLVDVPYGDRSALAQLTGGYIHVPVLATDDGTVIVESRDICAWLLANCPRPGLDLVPDGLDGAIWAYSDHAEGAIEDVLFRLATPGVRESWPGAWERALYTLVKERKYGAGCIDAWRADRAGLLAKAKALLTPTRATLTRHPFVFGDRLTLADVALYGQWAMLERAEPGLLTEIDPLFVDHARRVEQRRDALAR